MKGQITSLDRVIGEVRQTVQTMGSLQLSAQAINTSTMVGKKLEDLEAQTTRLETLAKSAHDDYESVRAEVALQREVTLRLLAQSPPGAPLDTLRILEEAIRNQVCSERELGTDAKDCPA
jgi:hypothetical protein